MHRTIKVVLVVTFMVTVLACSFCYLYISEMVRQRIRYAHDAAANLDSQLAYLATKAIPDLAETRVDTRNPVKARGAIANYLAFNPDLNTLLESVVTDWPMIQDGAILDSDGKAILHTRTEMIGQRVASRPDFQVLQTATLRQQLRMLYGQPTVYDVSIPLVLNNEALGSIRLGVSIIFLRNELTPRLTHALIFSGISTLLTLVLTAVLSYAVLALPQRDEKDDGQYDNHDLITLKVAHLGPPTT